MFPAIGADFRSQQCEIVGSEQNAMMLRYAWVSQNLPEPLSHSESLGVFPDGSLLLYTFLPGLHVLHAFHASMWRDSRADSHGLVIGSAQFDFR